MYEAKSTQAVTWSTKTECPPQVATAALDGLVELVLLLVEDEVAEVAGLRVEVMTGEVGDGVTVAVPCSTSKYIP